MKIKILIPVYNDWQSVFKLLENINSEVSPLSYEFSVIIVNDTSTENRPEKLLNLDNLKSIQIINMKENQGHARCNATGLKYIFEKEEFDYVIENNGTKEDLFVKGDQVKILDGPFAGMEAVYDVKKPGERAVILLQIANNYTRVKLSEHELGKV